MRVGREEGGVIAWKRGLNVGQARMIYGGYFEGSGELGERNNSELIIETPAEGRKSQNQEDSPPVYLQR